MLGIPAPSLLTPPQRKKKVFFLFFPCFVEPANLVQRGCSRVGNAKGGSLSHPACALPLPVRTGLAIPPKQKKRKVFLFFLSFFLSFRLCGRFNAWLSRSSQAKPHATKTPGWCPVPRQAHPCNLTAVPRGWTTYFRTVPNP